MTSEILISLGLLLDLAGLGLLARYAPPAEGLQTGVGRRRQRRVARERVRFAFAVVAAGLLLHLAGIWVEV